MFHMRLQTVKYVTLHSGKTEDMSLEKFTKKYVFLRVFLNVSRLGPTSVKRIMKCQSAEPERKVQCRSLGTDVISNVLMMDIN